MELQWFEEVPGSKRESKVKEFVEALKGRPGVWAIYTKTYKNGASANSFKKSYPGTEWKSRRNPDDTYSLYARYVEDPNPITDPAGDIA